MTKNICECPKPPGGKVICETNQIAICKIKGGEIISQCVNIPDNSTTQNFFSPKNKRFLKELYYEITSREPSFGEFINDKLRAILRERFYKNHHTGETINISIPQYLKF